ncbi:MAG: replication-associated recombination protein A [Halieaceae bacterium]|jgi:putative ATPase|nr:replication-associated recombination protein A [Halieaceae bacterium]MBT5888662.1 replication-associated recombination protein A [Halieaceae bacterium]
MDGRHTSHHEGDLFSATVPDLAPLAARMRPQSLEEMVGQEHLLGVGQPLRHAIETGSHHSFILWGPPGVGKTTLARLVSQYTQGVFLQLSAVFSGIKDIRAAVDQARQAATQGKRAILFVDEVHRFNKSQQDAFLPHIEDGTICFVGATTENPSFEVNSALLSRLRVYRLRPVTEDVLEQLLARTVARFYPNIDVAPESLLELARLADGDVRQSLNLLELATDLCVAEDGPHRLDETVLRELASTGTRRFDKGGDVFFDQISALHKAVRGSDPDASLYWFARMLDGGCDPLYIGRRCIRMASEDIGIADPRALQLALDAMSVQERLGSPEGELALAQAVVYLACAAKSNATYTAFNAAMAVAESSGSLEVPLHLRNAPTKLMREEGHGEGYRYAHNESGGFAAGEHYFPDGMEPIQFYQPTQRGLEKVVAEKLAQLRDLNKAAQTEDKP